MYTLARDEKTTPVVVYSPNKLIHGDLVTKENVRVSIWPRTQAIPNYLHFLKAQIWFFGGEPPKSLAHAEYFFPAGRMIGFHLAPAAPGQTPPASEPLDYDPEVANRRMTEVELILGAFILNGYIRISTQVDLVANIEMAHMTWLSVYDADISSPFLSHMPVFHVPMLLVDPAKVSFGFQ